MYFNTSDKIIIMSRLRIGTGSNFLWPIAVLIIVFGAIYLKPWQTKTLETVTVTATGKTQVTPNIANISATVESKNPNLDIARQQNEKTVSAIITELKNLGISEKDIKTEYISGGPGYELDVQIFPEPPKTNTNQLTTTLQITIRDFEIVNEVLASLTQNGATNLYGPSLTIDEKTLTAAKSKAREDAVENAKNQAKELAQLSDRKLGKVVKVTELGDFGYPIPILARSEADLRQKASIIEPGQNEVTISLQVDFALK